LQVCPFNAIQIINLPRELDKETTHRYGPNSFKLHRLPVPKPGQVLGLVGTNGIGKSTALKILAGTLKPNLGKFTVSKIEHLFVIPVEVTLSYET
jgi:ATP-binding cassette subfamily E protein 1